MTNPQLLIFTDLDGTLLGAEDYSDEAALPAIAQLQQQDIPLIPVTSKTRAEVEVLRHGLNLTDPFIVENGSGIFIPVGNPHFTHEREEHADEYHLLRLGMTYSQARAILKTLETALKRPLEGFGDLSEAQLQALTQLPLEDLKRAKKREFSEPFVTLQSIPPEIVTAKVKELGAEVVVGDRFSHLISRHAGKGKAVQELVQRYQRNHPDQTLFTVGLGNSPNDLPMLEVVDQAIILPGKKGPHPQLQARGWPVAPAPAPQGWADVVQDLISEAIIPDNATLTKATQ
ncbi:HAD-IIB family hydrolase [Spirulina sp. CS-785/01]|uniref:HAD-IIB family hydrolase n=1 Tax=Spirulina sp. CS-785/01 TaxID=3021716 RepID=UPI0023309176|nr:HAD-IIB family hydrolase [Spirulina sp. CS-785/01]MDB9313485.1 HAD-IIB family hydrolase [Spirulina sp. CS-785/01]